MSKKILLLMGILSIILIILIITIFIINGMNGNSVYNNQNGDIDDQEQTIAIGDRDLHRCGFGETQQNHRTGYMINLLGKFNLTAGAHTVEVVVKSGTFNVGTIAVFDHVEPAE